MIEKKLQKHKIKKENQKKNQCVNIKPKSTTVLEGN